MLSELGGGAAAAAAADFSRLTPSLKGQNKHINSFNINSLAPNLRNATLGRNARK